MRRRFNRPRRDGGPPGDAADPANSVWVSANAGSGKTHVLAQRVIRLLLGGTDPSKILCLTYTRAAAANMSNRVFRDLSAWTMLDDAALAAQIAAIEGRRPTAAKLARARRLFAEALETPGGLKIQTIHAFCEAVLHQFPLEANIAGHFELLDGQMEAALFAEARREMIAGRVRRPASQRGLRHGAGARRRDWPRHTALRDRLEARRAAGGDRPARRRQRRLPPAVRGVRLRATARRRRRSRAAMPGRCPAFRRRSFAAHSRGRRGADARNRAGQHRAGRCAAPSPRPTRPPAAPARRRLPQGPRGDPTPPADLQEGAARPPARPRRSATLAAAAAIREVSDRLALFRMLEGTRAALVVADWLIGRYERLKAARGFLDFNDLIMRTVRLLARADAGAWVQYKLDQGIDHILIDEAQDTSPGPVGGGAAAGRGVLRRHGRARRQAAHHLRGRRREAVDLFLPGRRPRRLRRDRQRLFRPRCAPPSGGFEQARLTWSFRSTDDVLDAVDRVFAARRTAQGPDARRRSDRAQADPRRRAGAMSRSGRRSARPRSRSRTTGPRRSTIASAPAVQVAENVARTIQSWIASGDRIEGTGKAVSPGDVLVLVRKRDRFVHALTRSLKLRRIDVAGADRLSLPDHIAVQDLIALGRFLLQPEDDLSLAALLRSPVFGLTEDELFRLAWDRGAGISLAAALRRAASGDQRMAAIAAQLDVWATDAAFRPVFEFYAGVLAGAGAAMACARSMVARLGREAGDILDEFLNFCLAQEQHRPAGAGSLPRHAGERWPRDQARDGPDARRGAHHDGARRQGPGGAGGLSRRRRRCAVQRPAPAAPHPVPAAARRMAGPRLSVAVGKRRRQRILQGRMRRAAREGRGRVPPPALCRHDAGRGSPHRLWLPRQARAQADDMARPGPRRAVRRGRDRREGRRSHPPDRAPLPHHHHAEAA